MAGLKLPAKFRPAIIAALASDNRHYKIGACIYQGNKLLAIGVNSYKTHPLMRLLGPNLKTLHAEVAAIARVKDKTKLIGASIFVFRYDKRTGQALCKPCPICAEIIRFFGIKKVSYTVEDGFVSYKV